MLLENKTSYKSKLLQFFIFILELQIVFLDLSERK